MEKSEPYGNPYGSSNEYPSISSNKSFLSDNKSLIKKVVIVSVGSFLLLAAVVTLPMALSLKCIICLTAGFGLLVTFLYSKTLIHHYSKSCKNSSIPKNNANEIPKNDKEITLPLKKKVTFGLPGSTSIEKNKELAQSILAKCKEEEGFTDKELNYVKSVVECEEFYLDPIKHAANLIIKRGLDYCCSTDSADHFILSQIPNLIDTLTSGKFLSNFADERYEDLSQRELFAKSAKNSSFIKNLMQAIKYDNACNGKKENSWKTALEYCYRFLVIFAKTDANKPYTVDPIAESCLVDEDPLFG